MMRSETEYGSPAFHHFKYNFLSSGHVQDVKTQVVGNSLATMSAAASSAAATRTSSPDEPKSLLEQEIEQIESRHAAGLGYGHKHPSFFVYLSQTKRGAAHRLPSPSSATSATSATSSSTLASSAFASFTSNATIPSTTSAHAQTAAAAAAQLSEQEANYRRAIAPGLGYGRKHRYYNAYVSEEPHAQPLSPSPASSRIREQASA